MNVNYKNKNTYLYLLIYVFIFILIIFFIKSYFSERYFEVDFLDVGQGDSVLVKTPFKQNILIDGGADMAVIRRLSEELPWYERTIDLMILTHPHDDHVGGLIYVLKRYKVKQVISTGVLHSSPAYISWLKTIKEKAIPFKVIEEPQKIYFGPSCYFDIIYPFSSLSGKEVENLNNSSVVGKFVYKNNSFFLSGDAEKEVEKKILFKEIESDVFKAGHHGSITSNTQELINLVNPKIGVIQVGKDNDFNHPSKRVLKRLERSEAKIFQNDREGTIKIKSNGKNIWLDK